MLSSLPSCDVAIVGAGAAGLATAIFASRRAPDLRIFLLDGAARPGAKILISGGSRCNVTNAVVRETDFWGGRRAIIRRALRGFPVSETVAFFRDLGVTLHEEDDGKLFPDSNRSHDVLDALLRTCGHAGVHLAPRARVRAVLRDGDGFRIEGAWHLPGKGTSHLFAVRARRVVLATGGASLPKTGSDGTGYAIAASLGHSVVPITPALAPLLLDPANPHAINRVLSGVSHDVALTVRSQQRVPGCPTPHSEPPARAVTVHLRGALLWTHFGVSGPVALNASRHWARAHLEGCDPIVTISLFPDARFETLEAAWLKASTVRPRASVRSLLTGGDGLPEAVAAAVLGVMTIDARTSLAMLTRDRRRRLLRAVLEWPLPITDTRGYNYAEVTAGGVSLGEIDPASMESRVCPGLFLVGEILDVDGRLGGFNFQWAWASAKVAAQSAFRLL